MLQFFIGLIIGIGGAVWILLRSRLKWNIPSHRRVEDHFTAPDKFWTTFCVGSAHVEIMEEAGTRGGTFARLIVNHADSDQLALAQIDDYAYRPAADYAWRPSLRIEARMRFSANAGPGTAGLYLWNNPRALDITSIRPFKWIGFYRTSPNSRFDLSGIPHGFRASVVNGSWLSLLSVFGVPMVPRLRADEAALDSKHDWTQWHTFVIEWWDNRVELYVDTEKVLTSRTRITGPLSLVIWQDNNQPHVHDGKFQFKYDAITDPAWLDIDYLIIEPML